MSSTPESADDTADIPGMAPPPGVMPNYIDPYNRGYLITSVGSLLLGLMMVFVFVRVYVKIRIQKRFSWDDLTCGLAAAIAILYFIGSIWCVRAGVGPHQWNIRAEQLESYDFLASTYLVSAPVAPGLGFAKVTFFLMYFQLFRPNIVLRYLIYVGGVATALFYTGSTIAQLVFLTPAPGQTFLTHWGTPLQSEIYKFSVPHSAVGAGIDVYILALPVVGVLQLKLAPRRKIGVILIFMTGSIAVVASFLSMYYRSLLNSTTDLTWALLPVVLLCLVELCVGVICTCMPSFSAILRHHGPSMKAMQSLLSSRLKLLSTQTSTKDDSTKTETLPSYRIRDKTGYTNLEMPTPSRMIPRSEDSDTLLYETEIVGCGMSKVFPATKDADQIHLRQEVTISRV